MSADELRDLAAQPLAERRGRLDVVLAAHPEDIAARQRRLQAEELLADYPGMIADTEVVLASPTLERQERVRALDAAKPTTTPRSAC